MSSKDGTEPLPLVMLVEDDGAIATMYRLGLEMAGFEVMLLSDASALFEAIELEVPDAAILDWQLLGIMTGVDIIENLRLDERTANLPVLMLSNHLGEIDGVAERASKVGAREWLLKSHTTPSELAASLRNAIGKAQPNDGRLPPATAEIEDAPIEKSN